MTTAQKFIHTNVLMRQRVRRDGDVSRRDFACMICMGVMLMIAFLLFVWVRIYYLEVGYRISDCHKVQEELVQEMMQLKVERAALRSAQRLEAIAVNRLGMTVPSKSQLVTVPW